MLLLFGVGRTYFADAVDSVPGDSITNLCFITCAVVTLYLVGMADDLIGIKYRAKFVVQVFTAILLIVGGIELTDLHGFLGIHIMPTAVSVALTILLVVFITNAINLIDGIDGLASGLSAIACASYTVIFYKAGLHIFALLSVCTLAALIPFFYYNVFGDAAKHGKIFMGDTGALTIGLMLSVFSIRICAIPDASTSAPCGGGLVGANSAVLAFAPLLIPCCDVVHVYIHRIKAGRSPFLPDKTHIHHKLLALGMSQRVAMPTIVAASLLLTLTNYVLSKHLNITLLFALDLTVWIMANRLLSLAIRRRELRLNQTLYQ